MSKPVKAVPPVAGAKLPKKGKLAFHYQRSPTHKHQGVDLVARQGTPVRASLPGIVEVASSELAQGFSGYGRVVVVRSAREETPEGTNPVWCLYAHLDQVLVKSGERVVSGQTIATVGDTCFKREDPEHRCSAPHLHFEVSPRRYPQPSESPRLDPVQMLFTRGNAKRNAGVSLLVVVVLAVAQWLAEQFGQGK